MGYKICNGYQINKLNFNKYLGGMTMEKEYKSVIEMWGKYLKSIGEDINSTNKKYTAWYFCDNEKSANELALLVKEGTKRGTTSLKYLYEVENEQIPGTDDYSVITNYNGDAQCIIKNKKVLVLPFRDVTEELAYIEGEGDKSLRYWREVHIEFFTREIKSEGLEFNEDMEVVFEEFEVVYQ